MSVIVNNPLTKQDYPDPDIIRVGDTYYMISTTMHFMPGGVILKSYNLADWEIESYIYDELENTPGQMLEGEQNIYGKGMWAASIRHHNGRFYVVFVANDTHKTYLYQSDDIKGPWVRSEIEGFYHDSSLLFDDDGRVYIVYGNRTVYLTELTPELTGPKEGGLHRVIVQDSEKAPLGYEGAHFYKINGRYYVFFIHSLEDRWFRTEACFSSDSLEGEFVGGDVCCDDMGYRGSGVAQGGIVDTPDGKWFGILFQDRGGIGRVPVLVPMHWEGITPVFGIDGKVPQTYEIDVCVPEKADYKYAPLYASDDFCYTPDADGRIHLKNVWQWNHTPHNELWSVTERKGALRLHSGKIASSLTQAYNTLTQRTTEPESTATVTVDGSALKDGDYAGITALLGAYGAVALAKRNGAYEIVMFAKPPRRWQDGPNAPLPKETEYEAVQVDGPVVTLKCEADFSGDQAVARFFYEKDGGFVRIGEEHTLIFQLDHFCGTRFGLFYQSTVETGGYVDFMDFVYGVGK